jgi:hypothetical protein
MQRASGHPAIVPTVSERAQSQGPNQAEWERIKPILQRLYVVENRPLRDVVNILDQHHGFRATYVSHHFGAIVFKLTKTPENGCSRLE